VKEFLNKKHISGTVSEYSAVNKLLQLGFLVFKNVAPHGMIDLIAISPDDETFRIDVKTRSRRKTKSKKRQIGHEIYRAPSKIQKEMDVVLMIVDSDSWKIHPTRSKLSKWLTLK
jgi:Holliday junction resolvase